MRFLIKNFLSDNNIPYRTHGTNIAEGWIGVHHCPFCGDTRYHGGINLNSCAYSCWVCGHRCWVYAYLMAELGLTREQVSELARGYFTDEETPSVVRRRMPEPNRVLDFPKTFVPLDEVGKAYLSRRGFDPCVATRYNLKSAICTDYAWRYRVIIPFYIDKKLVGWTGRAVYPEVEPRYKNISNSEALVDMRSTLFNVDALQPKSILVEGPLDAIRIGGPTAAVTGLEYTTSQILMVKNSGVEECTIVFDGEDKAYKRAVNLAKQLSSLDISAYVIRLEDGKDPGSLTDAEAYELRQCALY